MNQQQLAEMFKLVEKAKTLERIGNENKALEVYLDVLKNYTPNTSDAYERPAVILERKKRYDEALKICENAIELINDDKLGGTVTKFEKRIEKLKSKMATEAPSKAKKSKANLNFKFNFKNVAIVIVIFAVIGGVLFFAFPKESAYKDVYIDMSDFDKVTELDGTMFIDEEGNKLPEITEAMIEYARNICNLNSEVKNSLIMIQSGTIGFGVLLNESISKDRASEITDEFIKALSKTASNYHKDLSAPGFGGYGGLYEHYDIIVSLGRTSDVIDYKASMNKNADIIVWRKK
ncbi:MAG: tetratricopeptide repeat protein [Acidaminobacteraceae bacterium]